MEDILAIVKAVVSALPETSGAATQEDQPTDVSATSNTDMDVEVDKVQEPSGNKFGEFQLDITSCLRIIACISYEGTP